jgi:hypothetical protein
MIPGLVAELCSKTGLIRAGKTARERYEDAWLSGLFVESFSSADGIDAFKRACVSDSLWAIKPFNSARGAGIHIQGCSAKELSKLDRSPSWVAQSYVRQPVLTAEGNKFDLRTWMLVTSLDPLRAYVIRDAHVRKAVEQYASDSVSIKNKCAHLTNGSVQKHCKRYSSALRQMDKEKLLEHKAGIGSIWSEDFMLEIGAHLEGGPTTLWNRLEDAMVRTVVSVLHRLRSVAKRAQVKAHTFQLLSFDFILDDSNEQKPVLIEVNPDGYLKKGFQRMPDGWQCTKDMMNFYSKTSVTQQDANRAERYCRQIERKSLDVDAFGKYLQQPSSGDRSGAVWADECKKVVAHHIAEVASYESTCWTLAFPTAARHLYLTEHALVSQQSEKDAFLAAATAR